MWVPGDPDYEDDDGSQAEEEEEEEDVVNRRDADIAAEEWIVSVTGTQMTYPARHWACIRVAAAHVHATHTYLSCNLCT